MDLKDYINKNLPNLNWNILPQIFEENNVELTEEIMEYLKTTPWNTNWNVLNFKKNDSSRTLIFSGIITTTTMGWVKTHQPINIDFSIVDIPDIPVIITIDETEYILPYAGKVQSNPQWGIWNSDYVPNFNDYPIAFRATSTHSFQILTQSTGTYNIKIEIEN